MSTKTSAELNVTRSTTRVHVPPGGRTTITFGDQPNQSQPSASAIASADQAEEEKKIAKQQESQTEVKVAEKKIKLAIVLSGRPEANDAVIAAVSKALTEFNVVGASFIIAPDFATLPYIAQNLVRANEALIVTSFLTHEFPNATAYSSAINATLYQIGITNSTPIIPAVIAIGSLLEVKATLPHVASGWIQSIINYLDYKVESKPFVPVELKPKPVVKPGVTIDVLLDHLRESIKAHGATGITGLGRKFRIMDDDKSGQIELPEFTKVIKEHGLNWTPSQIKSVFDFFDKDKSGTISYDEFLVGVRGELNERRKQIVLEAFQILDSDKMGFVDLEHIGKKYDASKHPDVIAGKRSSSEILKEFMEVFEGNDTKDGRITPEEFLSYYSNISASIDLDDYFELVIRNAWHISGGEGWCANTSNRRVLVTHRDGRQTVEEIKNDLGIKPDDKEAMIANLKAQGIKDVVSIELKGSTDQATPEADTPPPAPAPAAPPALASAPSGRAGYNPGRQVGGRSSIQFG